MTCVYGAGPGLPAEASVSSSGCVCVCAQQTELLLRCSDLYKLLQQCSIHGDEANGTVSSV